MEETLVSQINARKIGLYSVQVFSLFSIYLEDFFSVCIPCIYSAMERSEEISTRTVELQSSFYLGTLSLLANEKISTIAKSTKQNFVFPS